MADNPMGEPQMAAVLGKIAAYAPGVGEFHALQDAGMRAVSGKARFGFQKDGAAKFDEFVIGFVG